MRSVTWRPKAERALARFEPLDAVRIYRAVEVFALEGHGDVKALKGEFLGQYRLRVGKWRVFFKLDPPTNVLVTSVNNRGQAY